MLIGVSTAPGPTPTTVMPWGASSTPAVLVSMRMPPLDRQYGVLPGIGQSSWTEVMLMMRPPPPWAIICLAASWVPKNALLRLIARTFSNCVLGRLEDRGPGLDPGVVHHHVEPAEFETAVSIIRCRSSTLETSASTPTATSPEAGDLALELLLGLLVRDVVDDDLAPLLGQREHHRRTDAGVATGHDGNLAVQVPLPWRPPSRGRRTRVPTTPVR